MTSGWKLKGVLSDVCWYTLRSLVLAVSAPCQSECYWGAAGCATMEGGGMLCWNLADLSSFEYGLELLPGDLSLINVALFT